MKLKDAVTQALTDWLEEHPPEVDSEAASRIPRPGRRPAPRAAGAVALTVRVDPAEATEVDLFQVVLREETGHRVDKAELVRELLLLARTHGPTRRALVRRLQHGPG
ncbi:hypothetical protein ABZW30_45520 [Kitasatospora sp. NPDC004669]|uniref:hypothetical protein n=1 Tax=Kitasatospora sp. NPDC004669 TaxID=3154555 RepID=UPI0033B2BBE5